MSHVKVLLWRGKKKSILSGAFGEDWSEGDSIYRGTK